ncbi:mandelate racemase/muconate lactonizing enzyme family protein [Labilibacter marinus]|uniref:mandelate racemase/muconate lactonizing enzyme family protein n=1 Tax=Labilibacter marinus TaxID=1477105 RepID=UPI0008316E9E|nr:mandelate racemase/muconate lactonizing enzyme family protein [Labilibacter marinus]
MQKIKSYNIYSAKAKLEKPISDATHTLTEISFLVLRITTEQNIIGEAYLLSFQYSPQTIIGALKDHGEMIIGEEVNNTGMVFNKMNAENEYFGQEGINRWAQGIFNIAMWDAHCKILGAPIWKVLGTYKTEVPIYGSGGWISYTREELKDEVVGYVKRGFKAVKIKVGKPDWKEDLERLKFVRESVGQDVEIMMDANQGMSLPNAMNLSFAARDIGITWFEEPINHSNYKGFESLKNKSGISLAMGEREFSTQPLRELIDKSAIDIWQPDILRIGGLEAWRDSAALADAYDIPVLPHYYKDYDIPLLCTIPNGVGAESFDWIDPLIDNPLQIHNGVARPHQGAGWGFNFKDECLTQI